MSDRQELRRVIGRLPLTSWWRKSHTFILKRLCTCGWNGKTSGIHYHSTLLEINVNRNYRIGVHAKVTEARVSVPNSWR